MGSVGMGTILTELRNERQLTMDMLVEDINYKYDMKLNKSMVSRWERNENDPSLEMAVVLAKYYNVSLDYLIGLTDVKTPARLLASANRQRTAEVDDSLTRLSLSERVALTTRPQIAPRPGIVPGERSRLKLNHNTTNDDDFEFEFLNMDDDDKKGRK